jgi:hypothetical protein
MDFEFNKHDEDWAKEFRDACHAQANRPASFWAAQRANVRAKVTAKRRFSSLRVALASTAALLVIAGAMLTGGRTPITTPPPQTSEHHAISDQQLLADIDQTLADPTPDALAPMELISQDMDKSLQAHSNRKQTR